MPEPKTPDCLRALGRHDMPHQIEVAGCVYRHVRTFKHDFFAATGLYQDGGRRVICKVSRNTAFFGLPLQSIGRLLACHEAERLRSVGDLEGVPAYLGTCGPTGLVHEFVPGHELQKGEMVDDRFFERLRQLISQMHDRGIAYVDLEKRENILVGDDGRPYLVDFQISWPWPLGPLIGTSLGGWLKRRLQQGDWYHLRKHQRRFRPDQLTADELAAARHRPGPVRIHNRLTRPLRRIRRWFLSLVDPHSGQSERGRIPTAGDSDIH